VQAKLKYQRDFEREADLLGVDYAAKAGFEPAAMLRFLRVMHDERAMNPTMVPPYLQSHPLTGERMAYLEAALGRSEWLTEPGSAGWPMQRAQAVARANSESRRGATADYERRLALAKDSEEKGRAAELLGLLMVHGEDFASARPYLERAEKGGREVARELGRAYLRLGMLEEAEPRLKAAARARPQDWDLMADLGVLSYQQGDYSAAVAALESSLRSHSFRPRVERWLGRALDKLGERGRGFFHFAQAAELEGHGGQALSYYRKAFTELAQGELKERTAARIKELETELRPSPPAVPRRRREVR
jgi:predicted Zn-dependent protease